MPNQDLSSGIRLTRFLLAVIAAFGGFYGLAAGLIILIIHLCSLDSYGAAYMSPFVDVDESNHKDTLVRFPVKYFRKRPQKIVPENRIKQS
jgi:spore germination protein KA